MAERPGSIDRLFRDKTILVTGGTGSIGSEIVEQLLACGPKVVRVFSRDEHKQFQMQQRLGARPELRFLLGDVRDGDRLRRACEGVDIIFHAAALKHVPSSELNPFESVATNVMGTQHVIHAAIDQNVERVVSISTDKAVSPISVLGATKLLAEKIVTSAQYYRGGHRTLCSCVRFGNVIASRGSVLPLWFNQLRRREPVTITDPDMTRFILSIRQAVQLVFQAASCMQGGEIFILKMPVVRLGDLAEAVAELFAGRTMQDHPPAAASIIGTRPGEKTYESLMTSEEAALALETDEMFIVPPLELPHVPRPTYQYAGAIPRRGTGFDSRHIPCLGKEEIKAMLQQDGRLMDLMAEPTVIQELS